MPTYSYRLPGPNGGYHTTWLTDEQFTFFANHIPVQPRDFNALMRYYAPPPEFGSIEEWIANFDAWATSVLTGERDDELWARRQIGPVAIQNIKRALRVSRGLPEPAPPPAQPQPGPASKENKIAGKPSGVSFSIHVSDPYHAAALGHIADMLDGQIADRLVVEWLAYILDHFVDSNCVWDTEDDAVDGLIQAMEKTIKFLRTE